jgi:hypothetical protein
MKETRRILVVVPDSYKLTSTDRRYPVTVVVDGEYLIAPVAAVTDQLTRSGQIPESVIVAIENVGNADDRVANEKRVYDLTPPGMSVSGSNKNQGGDLFLDFIERNCCRRSIGSSVPRARGYSLGSRRVEFWRPTWQPRAPPTRR